MTLGVSRWIVPGLAAVGLLALSAVALTSPAVAAQATAPTAAPAPAAAAAAAPSSGAAMPGKAVFNDVCGNCHDLAVTTDQKKSRDDWAVTVNRMVANGAPLSDQQAAQVIDYLAKTYGTS